MTKRQRAPRTNAEIDAATTELNQAWGAFYDRYRRDRLSGSTQYSLPEAVLVAIQEEVPGLLTTADAEFEREFFQRAAFGMFLGQPIGNAADRPPSLQDLDDRTAEATRSIQNHLDEHRRGLGIDAADLQASWRQQAAHLSRAASQELGYTGWLISQREFREELAELQEILGEAVEAWGRFPSYAMLISRVQDFATAPDPAPEAVLLDFYQRWALERLLTWDWPLPMSPATLDTSPLRSPIPSTAGVTVFLPWSMLQGQQFSASEVVELLKVLSVPARLREWVLPSRDRARAIRSDYFELHARLYRYYWFGIRQRYGHRLRRNEQKLDVALAAAFGRAADTIRRHRLELKKVLVVAPGPGDSQRVPGS